MSIYHFKCVSCTKLMGITEDFLGKQMRCPHCQTIQMVPLIDAAGNAEAPPTTPTPSVEPDTDVMNYNYQPAAASAPQDLPQEILPFPTIDQPPVVAANEAPEVSPTVEVNDAGAATTDFMASEKNEAVQGNAPAPWDNAPSITGEAARKRPVGSKSMAMPILFFSLLSYSIMATAILILILVRMKTGGPLHPLEYIPDVDGDNPGAKRTKIRFNNDKERTQEIVPAHLRTKIGVAIRVGELEVTPLAVEKATVAVLVSGFSRAEPCKEDSLILKLKLKNVSADQSFCPLDYYFNRKWKEKSKNSYPPPFTLVQFGTEKPEKSFFGGPANWLPLALAGSKKSQSSRETVENENLDKILEPGEEMTAFLCTDGDDSSTQAIFNHQGPMLWRLQVRRGLVQVGAKEIPATAVIGVEFGATDIKPTPAAG
ncbi:MAG: hypothetical protein EBT92_13380 [Planctomycetes bacterium]|nr:hypothetical protein [Planctomycetota bacterium]NBY01241.1 hypothetical protein [Planctomycetota bacterium]